MKRAIFRCFLFAVPFFFAGISSVAHADESAAESYNQGFQWGIGPSILVPTDGGPLGGGLTLDARYGIEAGPVIVAPGGRLAGYYRSRHFTGFVMPTARVTVPLGPLAPFVVGGVGPGFMSNPSEGGVALMGGGGLMVHFGRVFGLGAEVTYQVITGTEFRALSIGPSLLFGFLWAMALKTKATGAFLGT